MQILAMLLVKRILFGTMDSKDGTLAHVNDERKAFTRVTRKLAL